MYVSIARNDIEKIRQLFLHVTLHAIPDGIRPVVEPFVSPVLNAATAHIARFTDVRRRDAVIVQYHGHPEEGEDVDPIVIPSQCPTTAEVGPGFYDFEGPTPGSDICSNTAPSWADPPWEFYLNIRFHVPANAGDYATVDYPGADFAGERCDEYAACQVHVVSGDRSFWLGGAPTLEVAWEITDRAPRTGTDWLTREPRHDQERPSRGSAGVARNAGSGATGRRAYRCRGRPLVRRPLDLRRGAACALRRG